MLAKLKGMFPPPKAVEEDTERPRRISEADEAAVEAAVARDRLESCLVEPDEPKQLSDADWRAQVAAKASSNLKVAKIAVGKAAAAVAAKFAEISAASAAAEAEARARAASTAFAEPDGPQQMSDAEWRASVRATTAASAKSAATTVSTSAKGAALAVKTKIAETSAAHAAAEKAVRERDASTAFTEPDEVPQPSDADWRANVRATMMASSGTAKAVMMASANVAATAMAKAAAAVAKALADDVLPEGPGPSVMVTMEVNEDGFVAVDMGVVDAPAAPRIR